ncbi:MAG: signal peptidase II [Actinobacteria bacterium]|nr:signal peptidase II [Actinomycetota bacterium]
MTATDVRRRLAGVAAVTGMVDLAVKAAASRWLTVPVELPGLTLRVTHNTGIAFGLGADQPFALVATATGLVVAVLVAAAWRGHLGGPAPAGLVVGGGVANVADRFVGGSVIDVFDLGWWPVFNLADVAIISGFVLLLITSIQRTESADHQRPRTPDSLGDQS